MGDALQYVKYRLAYTLQAAHAEVELALEAVNQFPDSEFKQTLIDFCQFAVGRDR